MKRVYLFPLLALLGLAVAIAAVYRDNRPQVASTPAVRLPAVPYDSYVAGAGLVEARTGNIAIGSPVSGVATKIYVKVGDHVQAGDALFKVDDRDLKAQLLSANAAVKQAEAALLGPQHRLAYAQQFKRRDPKAISDQALSDMQDAVALAKANLNLAKAQVARLRIEIARHTVRAPKAGEVLQMKMRTGEYVGVGGVVTPIMLFGGDDRLNLRVDVDEQDAWRVRRGAPAMAYVRGDPAIKIPLRYEYTEPYIVPKRSLTGVSTERTDTRVLQVIYSFEPGRLPVYAGQLLDVYIQAAPLPGAVSGTTP